jgi:glycosyltransferase involved in cell wall biosynthesis
VTGNALNVDGISWFLSDVWPRVIARLPDARLELIGSVCGAVAADVPSAIKHYTVAELSPLLARMSFAVNPLRGGSGLKIKMLDYFAHGVPAISTSVGAAGFPRNGEEPFVVCDESVDFAETVIAWLGAPEIPARYSARCAGYARLFSRESSFAEIDRALGVSHRAGSDPDCGGGPP